jgi:hypothetical protein
MDAGMVTEEIGQNLYSSIPIGPPTAKILRMGKLAGKFDGSLVDVAGSWVKIGGQFGLGKEVH